MDWQRTAFLPAAAAVALFLKDSDIWHRLARNQRIKDVKKDRKEEIQQTEQSDGNIVLKQHI